MNLNRIYFSMSLSQATLLAVGKNESEDENSPNDPPDKSKNKKTATTNNLPLVSTNTPRKNVPRIVSWFMHAK